MQQREENLNRGEDVLRPACPIDRRRNTLAKRDAPTFTSLSATINTAAPPASGAMSDSDDYGDEFDDTEFLTAATQAEKENTPAFQASPRPTKRRKLGTRDDGTALIPRTKQQKARRRAFVSSDEDEDDDVTEPALSSTNSKSASPTSHSLVPEERSGVRSKKAQVIHHDDDLSPAKETTAQKRANRIHVPTANLDMTDLFFTQPPQEHSPPWKPRGAIWAKQVKDIGVHRPSEPQKWTGLDAMKTMSLPGKQSISSRPRSQVPISPDNSESPRLPAVKDAIAAYDFTQDLADLPSDAFASSSSSPQKQDGEVAILDSRKRLVAPQTGLRQTTLFGRQGGVNGELPLSQVNKRYNFVADQKQEPPTHHKLGSEAMKTWVYPTNLGTIRDYQFNIVQRGLFNNLLVALPTGLGKTFIAATIMLNWFRWTTEAQIVFVAPTKPLVAQQIEACFHIVGIPRSATTMLTGGVSPALRSEEWKSKRVFFMTPQTLLNDLKAGYADPKKVVLLVVDEAHRATGAYAYVEVVSFLRRFNQSFRVLALTATPGADVESVQKVIDGLDISKVEIRTENSMDICSYVHQRSIEKHVFQNSEEMEMCMELYSQALQPLVNTVNGMNAYWSKNPCDLTPYGCQQAKKRWMQEAGRNANQGVKSMVNTVFAILASISQAMDLLKYHGMGPFYVKLKEFKKESEKTKSKYKKQILESESFQKLMIRLQGWVTDDNFVGHPKLDFLQQVILDHFVNAGNGDNAEGAPPSQTRIMVFAHFRDSAEEINRILKRHQPMIRPRVFVGQAAGKNSEGMTQKDQLEAIEQFKGGTYNTLIATSIGEEGLDIGEVDLIVCYDSKASPIRMLQRMGRTGRKRQGRIVMLQMQGKEENDANKAKDSYEKMQELIAKGSHFTFHDEISRRILPQEIKPVIDRRVVEIPTENSQQDWLPEPKKKGRMKKPPKVFHMPDGVLTGFVTAGRMDEEIVPKKRGKKAIAPVFSSEEVFAIPSLESVLLNDAATRDLERRFQTVFDDDDAPIINGLDYSRHPERQLVLAQPQCLPTLGRASRAFVDTMQRMHNMNKEQLDIFQQYLHESDCEPQSENDVLVSDTELRPVINEDMWADDDAASQTLAKPKAKARPGPKAGPKAGPKLKPDAKPKTTTTLKATTPRGRPRKNAVTVETPVRQSQAKNETPHTKTPNWRVSGLAQEGDSSSPPPTDPRFHVASQADTIGSDDTIGDDEVQDTQAYKLDSELASFIVEDEEEVDIPASSLPSLDPSGLGRGTQAVVRAAQPRRAPRAEKIFTSDPTDDDAIVTSDSDDDAPLVRSGVGASRKLALIVDSASEADNDAEGSPLVPRQRVRRVIEDDEDEDE
jgi:ERCC4-related helicase